MTLTREQIAVAFFGVVATKDTKWDNLSEVQREMWCRGGDAVLARTRESVAPEAADVAAARAIVTGWIKAQEEKSLCFYEWSNARNTLDIRIAVALATTRRAAFAAGVEASAKVALNLMRERIDDINEGRLAVEHAPTWYVASVCSVYGQEVAAAIRALRPEEPRDG